MTDDTFREHMRKALGESDEVNGVDDELWHAVSATACSSSRRT